MNFFLLIWYLRIGIIIYILFLILGRLKLYEVRYIVKDLLFKGLSDLGYLFNFLESCFFYRSGI